MEEKKEALVHIGLALLALRQYCKDNKTCRYGSGPCPMLSFCTKYNITPCVWDTLDVPNFVVEVPEV